MKCAIYDSASGRISRVITGPTEVVEANCGEGESLVEVTTETDTTHYVDVATGKMVAVPPQPDVGHTWNWSSRTWVMDTARAWDLVRGERNRRLAQCDWTDTASAPIRLGNTLYGAWSAYRQALRDITLQSNPLAISWPIPPGN